MEALVNKLISGSDEVSDSMTIFLNQYGEKHTLEELDQNNLREKLWEALFKYLKNPENSTVHHKCLAVLRILSRDKTGLENLITEERMNVILTYGYLANDTKEQEISSNLKLRIEALKLLFNLLYNSTKVQTTISRTLSLPLLIGHINKYKSESLYDVKLYEMRILFLITALNVPTRSVIKEDLHGDISLIDILKDMFTFHQSDEIVVLEDNEVELTCEILKVLFNLYINTTDTSATEDEKYNDLVAILYKLLLCETDTKQEELQSHIVHLLITIPPNCYSPLIPDVENEKSETVYQNKDISAISVLLKLLEQKLDCETNLVENASPTLVALIRLITSERLIRKYVRLQVLPPLKDVMKRPEEGVTLRAKLCKLLTSPLLKLRDLVAELVFVLCKENVGRMVKYTGYGNAAGMFANKGLLGGHQPEVVYSSESEDSDTEEYIKYKEQINPVTGCYERPKPNPMEGMTEEQKEHEALQLVGLMDKLTRGGVVQPCRIGDDGKPKPIEHVLELQSQQTNEESDSE